MILKRTLLILCVVLIVPAQAIAASTRDGQQLYQRNCVICHGADGNSTMVSAPNFKQGQGLFKSDMALIEHLRKGKNACPTFIGILREQDMYDVIAYIRTLYP